MLQKGASVGLYMEVGNKDMEVGGVLDTGAAGSLCSGAGLLSSFIGGVCREFSFASNSL